MAGLSSHTAEPTTPSTPKTGQQRRRFIDPPTLMRIKSLELRAKSVVEGFWQGLNRSPYHGFSVEFTEYRQYSKGDDLRYLDWKLYARSDRYYIKRFEDETNLRCHLLLDTSRSMSYGSLEYSKADYARTLAATLGYFLSTQRDAVGLLTFGEKINEYLPARYRAGHLRHLMLALEKPSVSTSTNLSLPLGRVAEQVRRRGMFVLISDLLTDIETLETKLSYLTARGHEVLLFHILDPAELDFDFQEPALFQDMESGREIYIDPQAARETYARRFEDHLNRIRTSCEKLGITYQQLKTDTPLELTLSQFLRSRMQASAGPIRSSSRSARRRPV